MTEPEQEPRMSWTLSETEWRELARRLDAVNGMDRITLLLEAINECTAAPARPIDRDIASSDQFCRSVLQKLRRRERGGD